MRKVSAIFIVIVVLCLSQIGIAEDKIDLTDEPTFNPTPDEVHKWLWENELKPRLLKMQQWDKQFDKMALSNWQEYDVGFYRINMKIDHVLRIIHADVGIHGTIQAGTADSIAVHLSNDLTVDSVYNSSGNLTFNHSADLLRVYLERDYSFEENFNFTVVYHGTPVQGGAFQGFTFADHDGLPLITTLSQPFGSRGWWPCNDITTDKADSVDIIITVDTSLVVSSNGSLISDVDNGDGTHTVNWQERYPIVPYLVSLGIHPYEVWYDVYEYGTNDSMPLHYYVYPDEVTRSQAGFSVMPEMIGILGELFGQYPFINEKYGCTHFDWGGAMEHQTNTSTQASSWGYSDDIICHELAHQWFGDYVTCSDWHHIWINEGFASYAEALYHEEKFGITTYHNYMNSMAYKNSGSIYISDTTSIGNIFGTIVYNKGAFVLHMLRNVIGEPMLLQSFQDFIQLYKNRTASTEDFQAVVENVSGQDLDYFFQQWIYGTYYPNYNYSMFSEPDPGGGYTIYVNINQIQSTTPQVFTMPIDLHVVYAGGEDTVMVFNNARDQNFIIHSDNNISNLLLDPDKWILRDVSQESYGVHLIDTAVNDGIQYGLYGDTILARSMNGSYTLLIISGALPDGLVINDSTGEISGVPLVNGQFAFTVEATDNIDNIYKDTAEYVMTIDSFGPGQYGDVNLDGSVNLGDAIYLINHIFKGGLAPVSLIIADVNGDCRVNLGDAIYLINFVFKGGPAPVLGCAK